MERLRIIIPGDPVPWMRAGGHGRMRFTPPRQREYQSWIRECAMVALDGYAAEWPIAPETNYDVRVGVCKATARRYDIDNCGGKQLLDSCNGVLWHDDSQVKHLRIVALAPSKADACMIVDVLPWVGALPTVAEYLGK